MHNGETQLSKAIKSNKEKETNICTSSLGTASDNIASQSHLKLTKKPTKHHVYEEIPENPIKKSSLKKKTTLDVD